MVDLLMRMHRALYWLHLDVMCHLCSSLDFPTMLALGLDDYVAFNKFFLGLSFIWVTPDGLSGDTGSNRNQANFVPPRTFGQNRSSRFLPRTIKLSIHLYVCSCFCVCVLWLWCVVLWKCRCSCCFSSEYVAKTVALKNNILKSLYNRIKSKKYGKVVVILHFRCVPSAEC